MATRTTNTNKKGYTSNILSLIQEKQRNTECCLDFITEVFTEDSATVSFTGSGTESNPLIATSIGGGGSADDGLSIFGGVTKLGQTIGEVGNPATLIESREIPLNGHNLNIIHDDSGGGIVTTSFTNGDDFFTINSNSNSFVRMHLTNTNPGDGGGAGMIMQSDTANFGWFFYSSSTNGFQSDCLSVLSLGTGGIQFTAVNGPIRFGSDFNQPLGDYARFLTNGHILVGKTTDNGNRFQVNGSLSIATVVLPVTPVNGSLETDGTNLFFTVGGIRKTVTLV